MLHRAPRKEAHLRASASPLWIPHEKCNKKSLVGVSPLFHILLICREKGGRGRERMAGWEFLVNISHKKTIPIHKYPNFHQRKWLIFFLLHRNVKKSAKNFDFRWESPFSEVKLSILKKKKHDRAKLKHSIYLRHIFTFDLENSEQQLFAAIWDAIL